MRGLVAAAVALAVVGAVPATVATVATAQPATSLRAVSVVKPQVVKYKFKNCTALNKVYAHGVGRAVRAITPVARR